MRTKKMLTYQIFCVLLLTLLCNASPAKIIYVDDDAAGANDGTSWENAFVYLQDALADANSAEKPVEIRVAGGTYTPDKGAEQTPGDREATFQLINGVTLAGGYAGAADPNARDIELYETILSGDLNGDDGPNFENNTENSYHVVESDSKDETAIIYGFTITGGYYFLPWGTSPINDPFNQKIGTGMYNNGGKPTITNCNFTGNHTNGYGGGMYNDRSNPTLTNCTFKNNRAENSGGGMSNNYSSPFLANCTFIWNSTSTEGGGMYNGNNSNPALTNCIFSGNSASYGGGIYNFYNSSTTLTNCTFYGNSANKDIHNPSPQMHKGGGITHNGGNLSLNNCILWDNSPDQIYGDATVTYSNIQGGWDGEGNIDEDPLFAEPGYWADVNDLNIVVEPNDPNAVWIDGDYHLKSQVGRFDPNSGSWLIDDVTSPCIDAGDPNMTVGDELFPNGGIINLGAYGGTAEASMSLETGGLLLPDVAFIYLDKDEQAESFQSLLESYGCPTTLIKTKNVTATSLESCDLVIVADDTYAGHAWTDYNGINAIEDSGKPIVGLGDGGYDFFGKLNLSIGFPYGAGASLNSIYIIDPNYSLFSTPYTIDIPQDCMLQLYTVTDDIAIYLWPDIPETVVTIGAESSNLGYYPLVVEDNRYFLWGFTETPDKMTETGKKLFINTVIWMANAGWENEN